VLNSIGVPPAGAYSLLHLHGELALVEVARHRLDPARGDADERLGKVLVGEADGLHHRAGAGAVDAVGQRRADALGGIGRLRVDTHAGEAPSVAIARGRTCASPTRARRRCATAAASAFAAQTTTTARSRRRASHRRFPVQGRRAARRAAARLARGTVSCSRSWNAAASRSASPDAIAAPSSAAWALAAAALAVIQHRRQATAGCLGGDSPLWDDDDRRERHVVGDAARVHRAVAVPPAEADAAEDGRREVVGVSFERQAELDDLVVGRPHALRRRARRRVQLRSSLRKTQGHGRGGIRFTNRKSWPSTGATSANARSARCSALRGTSSAPSPSSVTVPSPGVTSSSFQRSNAAPAQSKPGPRFADVAGARTCTPVTGSPLSSRYPGEDSTRRSAAQRSSARPARRPRPCPSAR